MLSDTDSDMNKKNSIKDQNAYFKTIQLYKRTHDLP